MHAHVPRMQNLHANVDALSGCVLHAYGVPLDFLMRAPVMGSGRAMGFLVQHVWDKALGLPLELPLSVTMDEMLLKAPPLEVDVSSMPQGVAMRCINQFADPRAAGHYQYHGVVSQRRGR
ncbi:hypothetical protein B0H10DRAFT_1358804 [Mycena sp. CBHHK59/15]|nr:hypothetical protein B0H10DRAFT_1358804 [Mycena sp. CBHHK59/15]